MEIQLCTFASFAFLIVCIHIATVVLSYTLKVDDAPVYTKQSTFESHGSYIDVAKMPSYTRTAEFPAHGLGAATFMGNDCKWLQCDENSYRPDDIGTSTDNANACVDFRDSAAWQKDKTDEKFKNVNPRTSPPMCSGGITDAKGYDKKKASDLLTIFPEMTQTFENSLHAGFDYKGHVTIATESMLPFQCQNKDCDASDGVSSEHQCKPQKADNDRDGHDVNAFQNPQCQAYFNKIQQTNTRFAAHKDVLTDMQEACWLPQAVKSLQDSSVAEQFILQSNLNVVVYPLKYDVDVSTVRTAAMAVCSKPFVFGLDEDATNWPTNENTDNTFAQGSLTRKFLVCYNDLESDEKGANSNKNGDHSWDNHDGKLAGIDTASWHLSVFYALRTHLDGYTDEDITSTAGSFLLTEGEVGTEDAAFGYLQGVDGTGYKLEGGKDLSVAVDMTAPVAGVGGDMVFYALFSCTDPDSGKVSQTCKTAAAFTKPDKTDENYGLPIKMADKVAAAEFHMAKDATFLDVEYVKTSNALKDDQRLVRLTVASTLNAGEAALGAPTTGTVTLKRPAKQQMQTVLQDKSTFFAHFKSKHTKKDQNSYALLFAQNWDSQELMKAQSYVHRLGPRFQTLGAVCQWSRQLFRSDVAGKGHFDTFATPLEGPIAATQIVSTTETDNLAVFSDTVAVTRRDASEIAIYEAMHYAQSKALYEEYESFLKNKLETVERTIELTDESCTNPDIYYKDNLAIASTKFGSSSSAQNNAGALFGDTSRFHDNHAGQPLLWLVNFQATPQDDAVERNPFTHDVCQHKLCSEANGRTMFIHLAAIVTASVALLHWLAVVCMGHGQINSEPLTEGKWWWLSYVLMALTFAAMLGLSIPAAYFGLTHSVQEIANEASCLFEHPEDYTLGDLSSKNQNEIFDVTTYNSVEIAITDGDAEATMTHGKRMENALGSLFAINALFYFGLVLHKILMVISGAKVSSSIFTNNNIAMLLAGGDGNP
jgi:hypothetical protein